MTCTSCGAANEAGRKFCLECGAGLAAVGGGVMATLLDAGEPRIRAAIEESRRLFERMGANLWLVLLDRALAAGRPVPADPVRSTEIGDAIPR